VGGYGVSKLDPALRSLTNSASGMSTDVVQNSLVLAAIALTSTLTAAALTYITRRYWDDAALNPRKTAIGKPTE
jgi:hypothetical protein